MSKAYQLGIFYKGQIACPDELPGESAESYYTAPRHAKQAGREVLARHPDAIGFDVTMVFNGGHYRTVHVEYRAEVVAQDIAASSSVSPSTVTVEG